MELKNSWREGYLFGGNFDIPRLPAAEYQLLRNCHLLNNVFYFCLCSP